MTDLVYLDYGASENFVERLQETSFRSRELRDTKTPIDRTQLKQDFPYADIAYVEEWMDTYYPGWSFSLDPSSITKDENTNMISILGTLIVYEPTGIRRSVSSYGTEEFKFSKETGKILRSEYVKNMDSDAFKRCAARLGCASDLVEDYKRCGKIVTLEEIQWLFAIIPNLIEKTTTDPDYSNIKMMTMIKRFMNGIITIDDIINKYPEITNDTSKTIHQAILEKEAGQ